MKLTSTSPKVSPLFFRIFKQSAKEEGPVMWWPNLRALIDVVILITLPFLIHDMFWTKEWVGLLFYGVFWLRIFFDFSGPDLRRRKKYPRYYS